MSGEGKFPSPEQVRGGGTLPLGSGHTDERDQAAPAPSEASQHPAVAVQQTTFVAYPNPTLVSERRPIPKTLTGVQASADLPLYAGPLQPISVRPGPPPVAPPPLRPQYQAPFPAPLPGQAESQSVEAPVEVGVAVQWQPLATGATGPALAPLPPPLTAAYDGSASIARASPRRTVLIGAVLSLATVGLGFWPITAAESADGVFSRYSRATIIESRIAGAVVAIHVRPGQHVAAGAQLVTLRSEAVERELSDIDAKLEQLRRSRDIVQSEQRAQPSELEVRRSQTLAEVEARLALTRSELAAIEDKRDALLASAAQSDIAPLKLSALDDRVDVARTALRAASAQRKSLEEQPRQSEADPALETGALARESLRLQERRSALERKRQSAGVEAPAAGVVAQLLPSVGDTVPDAAPMVRVIPAGVSPSLVVSLDALDASALGDTTSAPTEVNLSAAHGVISFETRVVRVTREAPQASADHAAGSAMLVELMLNDAAQAAALVVALAQDPAISLHYRRELPLASWIFTRLSSDT